MTANGRIEYALVHPSQLCITWTCPSDWDVAVTDWGRLATEERTYATATWGALMVDMSEAIEDLLHDTHDDPSILVASVYAQQGNRIFTTGGMPAPILLAILNER